MEGIFEIIECDEPNSVNIMLSDNKESIAEHITAYEIKENNISIITIYNDKLNKSIIIRTEDRFKLNAFTDRFMNNIYLVSPYDSSKISVYNLTKMTSHCKLYKLHEFLWNIYNKILDSGSVSNVEYSIFIIITITVSILMIVLAIYKIRT
jgi:hypothetical protein